MDAKKEIENDITDMNKEKASKGIQEVDEGTKALEHKLDFSGFALNLAVTVFYIGEVLPVVGGACRVCKEIVKDLKDVHKRVTDTMNILRRIVDVAVYLQELPKVLKFLPDTERISNEISCLTDLLSQVRGRVSKYSKVGFLSKMIKAGSRLKKLSNLDALIKTQLANIKDLFSIVRDENVARKLVELSALLNREPSFPLEIEVESIQNKVEETKLTHDNLNEDEVILKVLGDSEIQEKLVQGGGLASDVIQKEIVNSLNVVSGNIDSLNSKVDKLMDHLSNPRKSGYKSSEPKYHVVIALQPPPSVILENNIVQHKFGYSFEKQSLIHKVKEMIDIRNGMKVCISATNRGVLSETISQANCFVYLGTGIGFEEPISTESQENILLSCNLLPRVIITGLKYGAKQFADRLARGTMAREVHAIIWVRADIEAQLAVVMKLLPKTIENFDDRYLEANLVAAVKSLKGQMALEDSSFGIVRGGAFQKTGLVQSILPLTNSGDGHVHIEPVCDLSKNNIIVPDPAARNWHNDAKNLCVLGCDKGIVFSINRALLNVDSRKMIVIRPSEEKSETSRHRAIAYEVVKKLVVSKEFNGVFRVSTMEELSLMVQCINTGNFSSFIHSHHESNSFIKGEILIWVDLQEISFLGLSFLKTLENSPDIRILLNFDSSTTNQKFEVLYSKHEEPVQRIKYFDLVVITSETRHAVCSSLHDEIFFDVDVIGENEGGGSAHFDLKFVASALQSLLGDDYCILAVYEDDNNSIAVRVSLSDVRSLQYLFSLALMNDIGSQLLVKLKESHAPLCIKYHNVSGASNHQEICEIGYQAYDSIKISSNQTKFAKSFEKAMFKLENMTPHQVKRLRESKCGNGHRIHVKAPAGSGKTFLAMQIIAEQLKKKRGSNVLFVTRNVALCLHVAKWFHNRDISRDYLEERFYVAFEPFSEGMKKFTIQDEKITFVKGGTFNSNFIVVFDEAHHLFATDVGDKPSSLSTTDKKPQNSLLHFLAKKYKSKEIIILSDDSQSNIKMPLNLFNTVDIYLSEVVRHSQRVLSAARQFSSCHFYMKCHHDVAGPALKTFVFSTPHDMLKKELKKLYSKHVSEAISNIRAQFPGLSLDGRVGIIVPDKEFLEEYRAELLRALRSDGYLIEFTSACEAAATFHENRTKIELILFDEINNFDGQERLIIIAVGFDKFYNAGSYDKVALFYRALTRTQMYFIVVNQHVAGGFLEWMGLIDSSQLLPFDESKERNRTRRLNPSFSLDTTTIHTNEHNDDIDDDIDSDNDESMISQAIRQHGAPKSFFFSSPTMKPRVVDSSVKLSPIQQSIWDTSSNNFEASRLKPVFQPVLNKTEAAAAAKNFELLRACNEGDIKAVVQIICLNVNLNCVDECDRTPAYIAACNGFLDILIILKDAGADLTIPCSTAIGSRKQSSSLGALLSPKAQHLQTPYTIAQTNGHLRCAKFISNSTKKITKTKTHRKGDNGSDKRRLLQLFRKKQHKQNPERWASSRMFSPRTLEKKSSSFSMDEKRAIQDTVTQLTNDVTPKHSSSFLLNAVQIDPFENNLENNENKIIKCTNTQLAVPSFITDDRTMKYDELSMAMKRDDDNDRTPGIDPPEDSLFSLPETQIEHDEDDASLSSDSTLYFDVSTLDLICSESPDVLRNNRNQSDYHTQFDDPMAIGYGILATNNVVASDISFSVSEKENMMMKMGQGFDENTKTDVSDNPPFNKKKHAYAIRSNPDTSHSVNNQPNGMQSSSLHTAVESGDEYTVRRLLTHPTGAIEVDTPNQNMESSLHLVAKKGTSSMATLLLNQGASINFRNKRGDTPLHYAVHSTEKENLTQLLLSQSAHVNSQNNDGLTPLHLTSRSDNKLAAASCLLAYQANINAQSKKGDTPLHLAVSYSKMNAVKMLVENGANIHLKNNKQVTPLQAALNKSENHPIRKYFLDLTSENPVDTSQPIPKNAKSCEMNENELFI